MAYKKKVSRIAEKAQTRADSISSIETPLNLPGLSLDEFVSHIRLVQTKVSAYNRALSEADQLANEYKALENELQDMHERMLAGIASQFGKDSSEYEAAGGVRKSDRKRPKKKTAPKPASVSVNTENTPKPEEAS